MIPLICFITLLIESNQLGANCDQVKFINLFFFPEITIFFYPAIARIKSQSHISFNFSHQLLSCCILIKSPHSNSLHSRHSSNRNKKEENNAPFLRDSNPKLRAASRHGENWEKEEGPPEVEQNLHLLLSPAKCPARPVGQWQCVLRWARFLPCGALQPVPSPPEKAPQVPL
jgi:hypothetical protein